MRGDQARASVGVAVPPQEAFDIFTREIDLWWRRGPRFRRCGGERALIAIEPRVGGRVFEAAGVDLPVQEVGHVLVWQPPRRLVFEWRGANFAPNESTEVEVLFEPSATGTLVTVTHRGWAALRGDHPVRHGQDAPRFIGEMGRWWGGLLSSYRVTVNFREPDPS
jgi:uncharacterized protein YndB with AHSA1/START domain